MRVVGSPKVIRPVPQGHLSLFVGPEPGALVFPGAKGGPLRSGNFSKLSDWPHATRAIGAEGRPAADCRLLWPRRHDQVGVDEPSLPMPVLRLPHLQ
jgi:hypothetical protein